MASYKKIEPLLEYEILIPEEIVGLNHVNKRLMIPENVIVAHFQKRLPYFEVTSGTHISLDNVVKAYNIIDSTATNIEIAINSPKTQEDEGKEQERLLFELKNRYQEEDLTLVLGAGVSIDAGVLQWNTLINSLLAEMINVKREDGTPFNGEEIDKIIEKIYGFGDSPLALMQYVRLTFDYEDYIKIIHKVLYDKNPQGGTVLLSEIANLCKPRRKHLGVKNIITYNFDDLLERTLTLKEIEHKSIYRDIDTSDVSSLNIYHVHGFLPHDLSVLVNGTRDINLVFSEEDYHRIYRDSYCWSNIVQLNCFRENSCLFIGCSLSDPNLRRLLDVAISGMRNETIRKSEKLPHKHYAILRKRHFQERIEGVNQQNLDEFIKIDNSINQTYLNSLGIGVIWVEEFRDIPNTISSLLL